MSILISLATSAPWLVLSALLYVVGIVGYYAGREPKPTPIPKKQKRQPISTKIDPIWSYIVSAVVTLVAILLQYSWGYWNEDNVISGVIIPIFYSIIAGSIGIIVAHLLITKLD